LAAHLVGCVGRAAAGDTQLAVRDLRTKYVADIKALAQWCDENGLSSEAKQTRQLLPPAEPDKLYLPVLPDTVGPAALPENTPANVVEWDRRLGRLRRDYASSLYEMARRLVRAGRAAMAFDLVISAIAANPDSEPVRRLLGYQKFQDHWYTQYEWKKLRGGFVWSDRFGWLRKDHLRRYEAGQRFFNGRWISAAEDAAIHRDIESGWIVETEHYAVRTNHSIEAGVAMGVKLERIHRLWRELFVRYYASEADVVALFDGHPKPLFSGVTRHNIVCFRDRDSYLRALRGAMPNIDVTIGMYIERNRQAYFFVDEKDDDRTLYHEATHQLFHESRPVAQDVAFRANFWIVEGIAMYMESLRQENGYYVLGGFEDDRVHAARYRLLHDKFYVPLAEFSSYGMERLQKDSRIATLYSQAAGLTSFLVYYDNGRYRDALVQYLVAVYTGRDTPTTLNALTGVSFPDLDKEYFAFMEAGAGRPDAGRGGPRDVGDNASDASGSPNASPDR
jgi:hypothetical protein